MKLFDGFILSSGNIIATSNELNIPLSDIIAPLADNGGDTLTHALVAGSPAIDAGNNSTCLSTDQRGEPRNDSLCDIGSYEGEFGEAETFFVIPLEDEKAVVIPL